MHIYYYLYIYIISFKQKMVPVFENAHTFEIYFFKCISN